MGPDDVTVVIPTIPPRRQLLTRAVHSAVRQNHPPAGLSIAMDIRKEGAAKTRQRALMAANTPLVAFLDDDDEFMPFHLHDLVEHMRETGADYVYSWYRVVDDSTAKMYATDPVFPETHFTEPWDDANPRHTTITTLVNADLAKDIGFVHDRTDNPNVGDEDWQFTLGCIAAGAKISHLVKHTWIWHHGTGNTSGLPSKW